MATVAARHSAFAAPAKVRVFVVLGRRALRDARTRTIAFAYLFIAVSYLQPVAYRHTYATLAERVRFAHSFANNKAVVLFYGKAYDLLTVGGYSAWRVGGTLAIFAAVFGMLAAVRALRAEEDAGRAELVLASTVGRGTAFGASMAAVGAGTAGLWLAAFVGLLAGGLPVAGSGYLSLAVVSVVPVFVGVGALICQLASTKRIAIELGGTVVALCFLLRVIADTSSGAGWVRWITPLGWAEELRPFTGARPLVLLAPLAASALLIAAAARIAARRDVGTGLLASHDSSRPRLALLSSATAQALRAERVGLLVWTGGVCALALVIGVVSKSVTSLGISKQLERTLEKLGAGSALTPKAYIGFSFSFFVLVVCLFAVSQVAAARHEEADERLETLLTLPLSRRRWLGGRLALAAAGAVVISLGAGVLAWLGAVSQGVSLSLPQMLEAGANCLPAGILFLGIAALAYAAVPRASSGIAYGLVVVAYLWQLVGSLLGAPGWLVHATPFAHIAAVPAVAFRPQAAAIIAGIGLVAAVVAVGLFERRDLMGA
jgi:ABC-2 type transport system permease protein